MAYSEPFIVNAAIEPPAKVGTRSSARSNIGCAARASARAKAARSTPAAVRAAMTPASDQPSPPARMSP
jgi:hypothetical protein